MPLQSVGSLGTSACLWERPQRDLDQIRAKDLKAGHYSGEGEEWEELFFQGAVPSLPTYSTKGTPTPTLEAVWVLQQDPFDQFMNESQGLDPVFGVHIL